MLERGPPYPQVILPQFGGYWIEDQEAPPPSEAPLSKATPPDAPPIQAQPPPEATPSEAPPPSSLQCSGAEVEDGGTKEAEGSAPGDYGYHLEEINEAARAYRNHFLGRVSCDVLWNKSVLKHFVVCSSFRFWSPMSSCLSGTSELLLPSQQFGKPAAVCETRGGEGTRIPAHHHQVNTGTGSGQSSKRGLTR